MLATLFAISTFLSTLVGGLVALRSQKWVHKIMGYTAGVLLGVVAFDILPEIFDQTSAGNIDITWPMIALVAGFLIFHVTERLILLHHGHEDEYGAHRHPHVGLASAIAICAHSFLDGVGIGLGFQAGTTVGIAIAIAVIAHDFSDGLNTINLMLHHKNAPSRARKLLYIDAVMPVMGAVSTLFFSLSGQWLVVYLGFFAGFLLYIGASDILPQAHAKGSSKITILLTILGVLFMYLVSLAA